MEEERKRKKEEREKVVEENGRVVSLVLRWRERQVVETVFNKYGK